jgi:hypothetical protein
MLYSEMIAVCSEIRTQHINTLCGQNVKCLNVNLLPTCCTSLYVIVTATCVGRYMYSVIALKRNVCVYYFCFKISDLHLKSNWKGNCLHAEVTNRILCICYL